MNLIKTNSGYKIVELWLILSMTMALSLSAAPLKIMMLGDSITEGIAEVPDTAEENTSTYTSAEFTSVNDRIGYRGKLWDLLKEAGYQFGVDIDFVGGQQTGISYDPSFDENHEGHGGFNSRRIKDEIDGWLDDSPADIVLLHVGANDRGHHIPIGTDNDTNENNNTSVNNIKKILTSIFTANPNSKVFVARIIEVRRAEAWGGWRTKAFNDAIENMVKNHPKSSSIKMVDMESGAGMIYDPCGTNLGDMQSFHTSINGDGVATYAYDYHPNKNGYMKMAQKWYSDMLASGWVPYISANTPEHLWTLEEDSSPFTDIVGGNSATCHGATCPTQLVGKVNNAQSFNGAQLLTVAADDSLNFDANEGYSVEFWMKPEISTGNQVVIGGGNTRVGYFWIGTNGSKLKFHIQGNQDDASIDIALGVWTHVALVKDTIEEEIRIYVNGDLVSTVDSPQATVEFANGLGIGHLNNGYKFKGAIDEVALYRGALSGAEVLGHYINGGESTNNLLNTSTPLNPRTAGSMETNDDGSVTMTAPTDYSYLYVRTSKTGKKGTLTRDLVAGETLTVKIRAKSSSMNSYIRSSQLNIPKTRFTEVNTYQNFVFNVTVGDNVTNKAYIGLYTTAIGESITVESVEVMESIEVVESNSLMSNNTPLNPRTAGSMETNDDGSVTMTAPTDYSYLYVRTSKTGKKGTLTRDLVAGETLTVKIRAKSSSMNSYVRSSQLNIPKTRFTEVNTYQNFVFNVTVGDNVTNKAYIGLYTTAIGENITVESVEILEGETTTPTEDTTRPTIILNGANPQTLTIGDVYTELGATAIDDRDGDITANIEIVASVDTNTASDYIVTYHVSDTAGNNAIQVSRTVEVTEEGVGKYWEHGRLQISSDNHILQHEDGTPFIWLADTAWALSYKLTQTEIDTYLTDRKAKGFSVILMSAVQNKKYQKNKDGQLPFINEDFTRPNEAYWKNIDYILAKAEDLGMYIALLPSWNMYLGENNRGLTSAVEATVYGNWIAQRYQNKPNIIWINGGDSKAQDENKKVIWNALAYAMYDVVRNKHLMTFHPTGPAASAWFDTEEWLDFDTIQTGHCIEDDSAIAKFKIYYDQGKPFLDIEPRYENFIKCSWQENDGYRYTAKDVRKMAYTELFLGGAGYTYGHNAMYGFYDKYEKERELSWEEALSTQGAQQMTYVIKLIKSRPFLNRIPDQSIITGGDGTAIRGKGYAFVYLVNGGSVTVDLSKLSSTGIKASWYNPTTGETSDIGEIDTNSHTFDSNGNDDVILILDDKNMGYPAP